MLTFYKINSEQMLEWDENPNDFSMFTVIIASVQHEFGVSTHIVSNRKNQKAVMSKFNALGHSTTKVVSQFDVMTETGVTCLNEGVLVIGLNALKAFIDAKRNKPFALADVRRVMEAVTVAQAETSGMGYAALSP